MHLSSEARVENVVYWRKQFAPFEIVKLFRAYKQQRGGGGGDDDGGKQRRQ